MGAYRQHVFNTPVCKMSAHSRDFQKPQTFLILDDFLCFPGGGEHDLLHPIGGTKIKVPIGQIKKHYHGKHHRL